MSRTRLAALAALLPDAGGLVLPAQDARLDFGAADVDARLGGGLAVAALHEFYAATEGDAPAVAAMAVSAPPAASDGIEAVERHRSSSRAMTATLAGVRG